MGDNLTPIFFYFLVKVKISGERKGWSGVENDYQAFNTNQGNNLGLWIEESLVTANISAVNK